MTLPSATADRLPFRRAVRPSIALFPLHSVAAEDHGASMIILGIHAGQHEPSATLFDDYRVLAAVQMERLNRIKGAGVLPGEWAWPCVDEVLSIHGLRRQDVDVVALTRSALPQTYYCKMRTPWRRLPPMRR